MCVCVCGGGYLSGFCCYRHSLLVRFDVPTKVNINTATFLVVREVIWLLSSCLEFSVIVSDLRNVNICLSQCQTLMAIVTYERVEDKLHTFLTSLLEADGC